MIKLLFSIDLKLPLNNEYDVLHVELSMFKEWCKRSQHFKNLSECENFSKEKEIIIETMDTDTFSIIKPLLQGKKILRHLCFDKGIKTINEAVGYLGFSPEICNDIKDTLINNNVYNLFINKDKPETHK